MIGNAHLDPVWLWQWQEGFQEAKATFRSALDRLREYPDFIFTSSSAAIYEWVEHNDPEMFAEIQARVAEGRWQICGGWWIQPDCNLPSGESFVRQGLYGQRYFQEKLGVTARTGYNVDSFGHHGMLPQILRKSGMDAYIFMRPSPQEMGLAGPLFWWEADDGSRVLTYRIPYEYASPGKDIETHIRRCAQEIKAPFTEGLCFYGVGNHGGGPTKENLECIRRLNEAPDLPRLVLSGPNAFFDHVRAAGDLPIPVVHTDLQHHASGCYAAHSGVKRWNRRAENALLAAEKWAGLAHWLTGLAYPADFAHAWKLVLFNQFHDILAGTSIEAAYEDARDNFGEALSIAARAANHAMQSISWQIDIAPEDGMKPIVVFNPHAWQSKVNVELEWGRLAEGSTLLDDADQPTAVQTVQSAATAGGRSRLSFVADLPPLGYRVYRVVLRPAPETPPGAESPAGPAALQASDTAMENAWFKLEFDPETGYIRSLTDKQRGVDLLRAPGARPVVMNDPSDTWSHNVLRFDNVAGEFRATGVKLVANGPVKAIIRVLSTYGSSQLIQDFAMYRDLPQIEVRAMVDWNERFQLLKLQFPLNLNFMRATYEIPYGHIQRPVNGEEEPGQSWLDVSGVVRNSEELYGLSLLNDSKYSFDVNNKILSMTVLRSPIYAHHDPFVPDPEGQYTFIDQGVQHFTYVLLPHPGSWETAGTVRRAAELNQPPTAIIETYHAQGKLPQVASYLSVDQDNIVVSAVKRAEDSDDLIIRCYETAKVGTAGTLRLPPWDRVIETTFGPCEIKTLRVPKDPAQPVVETNLLEWTAEETPDAAADPAPHRRPRHTAPKAARSNEEREDHS
jgi:alpha-mannosidase